MLEAAIFFSFLSLSKNVACPTLAVVQLSQVLWCHSLIHQLFLSQRAPHLIDMVYRPILCTLIKLGAFTFTATRLAKRRNPPLLTSFLLLLLFPLEIFIGRRSELVLYYRDWFTLPPLIENAIHSTGEKKSMGEGVKSTCFNRAIIQTCNLGQSSQWGFQEDGWELSTEVGIDFKVGNFPPF